MNDDRYSTLELINEILLRLPRKSFTRFTAACKSWESLITSPQFISSYYRLAVNRSSFFLLWRGWYETFVLLEDDGSEILKSSEIKFPDIPQLADYYVVGTHSGLVCFRCCCCTDTIFLWNPFIVLPAPTIKNVPFGLRFFSAFDGDFKVLKIPRCNSSTRSDEINSNVEVYSTNSGVWQRMELRNDFPAHVYVYGRVGCACSYLRKTLFIGLLQGVLVRNVIYWHFTSIMKCFMGLSCRKISIDMPIIIYLTLVGEWFSVIEVQDDRPCNIWVMKEYGVTDSWIKLDNINFSYDERTWLGLQTMLKFSFSH